MAGFFSSPAQAQRPPGFRYWGQGQGGLAQLQSAMAQPAMAQGGQSPEAAYQARIAAGRSAVPAAAPTGAPAQMATAGGPPPQPGAPPPAQTGPGGPPPQLMAPPSGPGPVVDLPAEFASGVPAGPPVVPGVGQTVPGKPQIVGQAQAGGPGPVNLGGPSMVNTPPKPGLGASSPFAKGASGPNPFNGVR